MLPWSVRYTTFPRDLAREYQLVLHLGCTDASKLLIYHINRLKVSLPLLSFANQILTSLKSYLDINNQRKTFMPFPSFVVLEKSGPGLGPAFGLIWYKYFLSYYRQKSEHNIHHNFLQLKLGSPIRNWIIFPQNSRYSFKCYCVSQNVLFGNDTFK